MGLTGSGMGAISWSGDPRDPNTPGIISPQVHYNEYVLLMPTVTMATRIIAVPLTCVVHILVRSNTTRGQHYLLRNLKIYTVMSTCT